MLGFYEGEMDLFGGGIVGGEGGGSKNSSGFFYDFLLPQKHDKRKGHGWRRK